MNTDTNTNKQKIAQAMEAMAIGNTKPFGVLMHPEMTWTAIGTNSWSGEFRGSEAIRRDLFAPLFANFTTTYVNTPLNILADGEFVVVECRGHAMTKKGQLYDQAYCYVIRMKDGLMISLIEYMDTELIANVLAPRIP